MLNLQRLWFVVPYYAQRNAETGALEEEGAGMIGDEDWPSFGEEDPLGAVKAVLEAGGTVIKASLKERAWQIQTYDRKGLQCLVGTFGELTVVPKGWESIDLKEAREFFERIKGRSPTEAEVS